MASLLHLIVALSLILFTRNSFGFAEHEKLQARIVVANNATTVSLEPKFFPSHGSKRVEIQYGPFTAPSSSVNNGMQTFEVITATKPCSDCLITWMQAGLIYPNGTYANANTGMWLHHVVLTNTARPAAVCGFSNGGERFFASGNERTPINICVNGTDEAGYYLGPNDNIFFLVELMNETEDPRPAVVTVTFEYIPSQPQNFVNVIPVWLDIGSCDNSELPAKNNTAFQYSMQPRWKADFSGHITWIAGHLHDGGTHLEVLKNGNTVCDCVAAYGQSPGYVESMSMPGMNMMGMDMEHISSISTCANTGVVNVGDEWGVTAFYNTSEHAPMLDSDGSLAPIMGISLLYVANGTIEAIGNATATTTGSTAGASGASTTSASASAKSSGAAAIARMPVEGLFAGIIAALVL